MRNIEQETFANYLIRQDRLLAYGFRPDGETLIFTKPLPADHLEIIVEYDGAIRGRIMDRAIGEEYTNFRIESAAGYSAGIRQQYIELLLDIRENCCRNLYFKSRQARRINEYIYETYRGVPEFLWPSLPSYAVFRRGDSGKWYAVVGRLPLNKLDPTSVSRREVEVINVKADPAVIQKLLPEKGYYPAFHMNKKYWVSILLDDTLADEAIQPLIRGSYESVS